MWPAAMCLGVLLLLVTKRPVSAFALLAAAALVKTYPAALLPVALPEPLMLLDVESLLLGLGLGVLTS